MAIKQFNVIEIRVNISTCYIHLDIQLSVDTK